MHEISIKFCVFIIGIIENNFYLGSDILLSPLLFEIQNLGDSLPVLILRTSLAQG